jgi:hypothetical protein
MRPPAVANSRKGSLAATPVVVAEVVVAVAMVDDQMVTAAVQTVKAAAQMVRIAVGCMGKVVV